jgi:LDH2 family malate/lactate/ureidoglycolate dehydrogenase
MESAPLTVRHPALQAFVAAVLTRWGAAPAVAERAAELMVRTDLRGVDSHGVGMLPKYQEWRLAGYIVPGADPQVVRDDGPTAVVDGNRGIGHHTSTVAMELAIAKARAHGVGFVAVRNSNHYGAAANYSMMALAHDMIGLSMTNTPWPAQVPTFGRQAMLGTNPISVAVPAGRQPPFVLDMATSAVAIGKLVVASRWAKPIPAGWALDARGQPTTDPDVAYATRLLVPLGGSRELGSHKGYGLAMMVDILAGVLAGAVHSDLNVRAGGRPDRANIGHLFGAFDVARFRPLDEFRADMDDLLASLKSSPPAEGASRVLVAGEPEWECETRRRRDGIPLAPALVVQLEALARALDLPFTLADSA